MTEYSYFKFQLATLHAIRKVAKVGLREFADNFKVAAYSRGRYNIVLEYELRAT